MKKLALRDAVEFVRWVIKSMQMIDLIEWNVHSNGMQIFPHPSNSVTSTFPATSLRVSFLFTSQSYPFLSAVALALAAVANWQLTVRPKRKCDIGIWIQPLLFWPRRQPSPAAMITWARLIIIANCANIGAPKRSAPPCVGMLRLFWMRATEQYRRNWLYKRHLWACSKEWVPRRRCVCPKSNQTFAHLEYGRLAHSLLATIRIELGWRPSKQTPEQAYFFIWHLCNQRSNLSTTNRVNCFCCFHYFNVICRRVN